VKEGMSVGGDGVPHPIHSTTRLSIHYCSAHPPLDPLLLSTPSSRSTTAQHTLLSIHYR
jgi:hypothetical protein